MLIYDDIENYIEHRDRTRIQCSTREDKIQVQSTDVSGKVRDISLSGMYCELDGELNWSKLLNREVTIWMLMENGGSRLQINTQGKVVRHDESGVAFNFSESFAWWPIFTIYKRTVTVMLQQVPVATLVQ